MEGDVGQLRKRLLFVNWLALYAALITVFIGQGCGSDSPGCQSPRSPIEFAAGQIQAAVDLGVIVNGVRSSEVIRVVNEGDRELAISKWVTSCECVSILPDACLIGPRAERLFKISAEENDPDFVGDLVVEVNGLSGSGECVVKMLVRVAVIKSLPKWE